MKKIALLLATLLILTSSLTFADTKVYNLQEATKQALQKNADMLTATQRIEIAKRQLYLANAAAGGEKDRSYISDIDNVNSGKIELLYPSQRQWDLERLEYEKTLTAQQVELDLLSSMYAIERSKQNGLQLKADRLVLTKELAQLQEKYKAGYITKTQVDTQQVAVDKNTLDIAIQDRAIEREMMNFNHLIGNVLNTTIQISALPTLNISEKQYDLKKILTYNYENALSVKDKQKQIVFKKLERQILFDNMLFVDEKQRETLNQEVVTLENELVKAKSSLEVAISNNIITIQNDRLDLKIAQLEELSAKRAYDAEVAKAKLGLSTSLELLKLKEAYATKTGVVAQAQLKLHEDIVTFEKKYFIDVIK